MISGDNKSLDNTSTPREEVESDGVSAVYDPLGAPLPRSTGWLATWGARD